jgi:hypothetical protein
VHLVYPRAEGAKRSALAPLESVLKMQYALRVFEYEDHSQFRMIDRDGEPWFFLIVWLRDLLGGFDHQQGFRQNTGIRGRLVAGIGKLLVLCKPLADDLLG